MKYFILLLFLSGCSHSSKVIEFIDYPLTLPPPKPPDIFPPTPPPSFIPDPEGLAEVQINPLPHPFNINGGMPYAVWVNGERLALNMTETRALAKALNLQFEQPKDTAEIHNGDGWLRPLEINKNSQNNTELAEEEIFIDVD